MFKENDYYEFHEINGEQDIEKIHQDIKKVLGL